MLGIPNVPAEMRAMAFGPYCGSDAGGLSKKRPWKHLVLQPHFTDRRPHPRKRLEWPHG